MFQTFITRVHRRYVVMHVIEQGVIGLLIGAIAGIILAAILIWRGLATESVAIATPMLGLVLGLVRGVSSRPQRMQAATEADRQLRLADLLGSALAVPDTADWADLIRSQADAVCRRLSPSDVVLSRLGVRVWGGAGLASALLCALALLPTSATTSLARQSDSGTIVNSTPELMQAASLPRPTTVQADPDSMERSRFGDETTAATKKPASGGVDDGSGERGSHGKEVANGRGAASANDTDAARLKLNPGKNSAIPGGHPGDGPGAESAGGGSADSSWSSSRAYGSVMQQTPPWKSSAPMPIAT
jgi:hypothetical protein